MSWHDMVRIEEETEELHIVGRTMNFGDVSVRDFYRMTFLFFGREGRSVTVDELFSPLLAIHT